MSLPRKRRKPRKKTATSCTVRGCFGRKVAMDLCKKHVVQELDRRCRAYVLDRDGRCLHCGSTENLQWAHLKTRRSLLLRWTEPNSITLCAKCHLNFTLKPDEFEVWVEQRWPGRWQTLHDYLVMTHGNHPDFDAELEATKEWAA